MKRRMLATVMAISTLCAVGCQGGEGNPSQIETKVNVWSTYNTAKVIRQTTRNERYAQLPTQLSVQMMQGEYEGAQLIITSNKQVSYTVTAGTLISEQGAVFPAEQVKIYHQKYIELTRNYNGNPAFHAGDAVPDMLLPMDLAITHGENFVQANGNQGITVEFNSEGVEAGTYTGTFELIIDGKAQSVPVRVEVWDIEYTGRREFQSSFLIYRDQLPSGEYDNTKETVDTYIDFLQEYKADAYVVRDNWEREHFEESVQRFAHRYASSIVIPVDFPLSYRAQESDPHFQEAVGYIVWLANESTAENMYIEYAYFYPSTYDEADIVAERRAPSEEFFQEGGEYAKTLQAAAERLQKDATFLSKTAEEQTRILQAVKEIPAVFTNVHYNEEWVASFDAAFCPYVSLFDDKALMERYQDAAQQNANGDLWAYSCSDPDYPYPTFHIDDTALGMRVNGWMNKACGINGYLYYSVNKYSMMHDENPNEYIDVFEESSRYKETNGDGFLLYPGKYYGSKTPFATLRLNAYRDGMDDYDMLCVYEKLLEEKAAAYGVSLRFDDYVADLYNTLFSGVQAYANDELVYKVRAELARRITALKNEDGLVFALDREENGKQLHIYTSASTLTVNGESVQGAVQGEGYAYTFAQGTEEKTYTVQTGEHTYTYLVGAHTCVSTDGITFSEGSTKSEENGKTVVTVKAIDDPDYMDFLRPSITYAVSGVDDVENLRFVYENVGEEELEMRITLLTESGKILLSTSYCAVGDKREETVHIAESLGIDWSTVTAVEFSFENVRLTDRGTVLMGDRKIALGSLWLDVR